jgi:tartrate dehydrogenase/decarboxylase/D-malate dehydrogenase
MLLEHLGEASAAALRMSAIETLTANPALHTRDLGGTATTAQVTQAVCAWIAAAGTSSQTGSLASDP